MNKLLNQLFLNDSVRKPSNLEEARMAKIQLNDELKEIVNSLVEVIGDDDEPFYYHYPEIEKNQFVIFNVKGERFLVDGQGYDYPRYTIKIEE
jgi:hypothetical protein